mmetsp:Transcript_2806/g.4301  ORF Transcript_2806/g.4301 Transcript_2806/m.4301 type:complete len:134 (-) Transcript_2806:674-1075(-)|eukprot:CAMPEP_0174997916 /NCGR_PEP_ID=MMETSP0005-20121125/1212_1 /TAXON_ID=420556 /ORGANISM="Ochromonas sp., Strain CCMP1393" /LENGTH=133 /DNA_ID=CAMNT_0016252481 /DNA_START=64 /DNA_END=465 /DNA_ORIENTATION=-
MAKDISKIIYAIEDEAMWDHAMEQSEEKLVVVDIHQDWCGCCEAIHPSISRVLMDYDECESRFMYCSASIGKVAEKIKAVLPADSNIDLEKNGCLPLFGVIRGKTCIMTVVGVDSPTLLQQITQNMPDKPVKE